jgi:FKBP-type peptidyl-prolyl cis-trans isomerase
MKNALRLVWVGLILCLVACSRQEPPPAPEPDETTLMREKFFGPAVADAKDITWRVSGLGIRIITPGEGSPPAMTDRIRVHYTGRLKDGTVFDDSHRRGKPSDFVVNQLITGWASAMSSLKPGGKAEIFIPPLLGYGAMQAGKIPPNSGLIFEVELIAVNP